MADEAPETEHDDPYALPKDASTAEQVWVMARIVGATLLILIGFALVMALIFQLT
jgi:hypothetical protein